MATLLAGALATLVFCAPGYPGAAGDAQPFVDKFAAAGEAPAGGAGGNLSPSYDPTEQGGIAKLGSSDAVLAFVPYPFYVEHAASLHLTPLAQADVTGTGTQERWSLVVKSGAVSGPAALAGYTVLSVAGYAPEFVRHSALQTWALPADVKIESTGQILSALRRVASGDKVAALLDQTQAASVATLPFATRLKTVTQSPQLPVALIVVVDSRLPAARSRAFQAGLLKMGHNAQQADMLSSLRLRGFIQPRLPQ
jgi:hypothetical protein